MSPRPSSAARVTDEPDDFEWPPTADELSVYDVGPDPCHPVHVAARDASQARRREAPPRAAASPRVKGITSRPPVAKVSRLVVVAIAAAVVLAAAIAGWSLYRTTPPPVPVETVHHPAPADTPPPRLKIVAMYPVAPAASAVATAAPRAVPAAARAGVVDAPSIPVAPAAAHHTLAGVAPIDAPDAPGAGAVAPDATPGDGLRPNR
jgi:hypothetical protein